MITNNQFMFVLSLAYFDVGNKLVARIVEYLDLTMLLMYAYFILFTHQSQKWYSVLICIKCEYAYCLLARRYT